MRTSNYHPKLVILTSESKGEMGNIWRFNKILMASWIHFLKTYVDPQLHWTSGKFEYNTNMNCLLYPYCHLVCSQMGDTFMSWPWPLHEGFVSSISKFWNMIIETMGCCSLLIVFNQPDGVVTPTDLRWLLPGKKSHTTPTRPRPRCCRHRLK